MRVHDKEGGKYELEKGEDELSQAEHRRNECFAVSTLSLNSLLPTQAQTQRGGTGCQGGLASASLSSVCQGLLPG